MVFAGLVLAGWVMAASGQDLAGLGSRLMWQMGLQCFALTTLCSIPPVIALGIMMRHGAPTDQPASALAVGAAAATWGAFIFAFHCPSDDPFYIVFWYSLACSTIIWLARLILPLISRW